MILGGLITVAMLCSISMSAILYKEGNSEAALPWFVLFLVSMLDLITWVVK